MATDAHSHPEDPVRGTGRYSADQHRWWDDRDGRWFDVQERSDTLKIELEGYAGSRWAKALLTALGTPSGTYRFVGVAHSEDARWPTYRMPGDTFPLDRVFPADVPPRDEWPPEMTNSLAHLRVELANHGWLPSVRGDDPWSYDYTRPCVETPPTDEPCSSTP